MTGDDMMLRLMGQRKSSPVLAAGDAEVAAASLIGVLSRCWSCGVGLGGDGCVLARIVCEVCALVEDG
jgi:hypothetical protein